MTDTLMDSYPMPQEEGEDISLSSEVIDATLPPFENITEDDIFAHNIDDALMAQSLDKDYDEDNLPEREYIPMPTIFEPIPEEAQKEILSKFALKKREKESNVVKTAQRLVNQFRALSAFRDDFVAQYNEELLNSSEEVLSFMPTIIGGPAVREYLDYLLAHKQQGKVFDQDNIDFNITKQQGYLPSPDEDVVYPIGTKNTHNVTAIDQAPLIQQTQILAETLNTLKTSLTEQTNELKSAVKAMSDSVSRPVQITGNIEQPIALTGEDTTNALQMQRSMMESAFEKMITLQSELFQKTVEELSKTVQTMQEQLRPAGVVRQALSSLKAAQQTPKEASTSSEAKPAKDKKTTKRSDKKEESLLETKEEKIETLVATETPNSNKTTEDELSLLDVPNALTKNDLDEMPVSASDSETKEISQKEEKQTKDEDVNPFIPVKTAKEEKPFSLLDELGIEDELDLYRSSTKKNKSYSLLDELEDDEMEILSEFDISKND